MKNEESVKKKNGVEKGMKKVVAGWGAKGNKCILRKKIRK